MTEVPPDALFEIDGEQFVPTALTTGPWRADAMHGGPPAALAGRLIAGLVEPDEHVGRVNVELERPVPLEPLTTRMERRQISRRVAHVDVTLRVESSQVVSARAVLLRVASLPAPRLAIPDADLGPVLGPDATVSPPAWASGDVPIAYHRHAVEHRMPPGSSFGSAGPATSWVRLRQPIVAGEEPSGLSRVLAAADFGSGISAIYDDGEGVGLINADLSVALARAPVGEWIRLDAETRLDRAGSALCITDLADTAGPLGVATQSLLGLTF